MTSLSNIDSPLSVQEHAVVNAAHEALVALKKQFEHWTMIGRGLQALRDKAERIGGRKTFDRLREQHGLGKQHLGEAVVSRLKSIMERLPEVEAWRATLTEKQRYEWASPSAVVKHCPLFRAREPGEAVPKVSPLAALKRQKQELEQAKARIHELEEELGSNTDHIAINELLREELEDARSGADLQVANEEIAELKTMYMKLKKEKAKATTADQHFDALIALLQDEPQRTFSSAVNSFVRRIQEVWNQRRRQGIPLREMTAREAAQDRTLSSAERDLAAALSGAFAAPKGKQAKAKPKAKRPSAR